MSTRIPKSRTVMKRRAPHYGGKDPAMFDAHRRRRGPLKLATGPGSYGEWKLQMWAERKLKRAATPTPPVSR